MRELHTHIHLNYVRVEILSYIKKKKKKINLAIYQLNEIRILSILKRLESFSFEIDTLYDLD